MPGWPFLTKRSTNISKSEQKSPRQLLLKAQKSPNNWAKFAIKCVTNSSIWSHCSLRSYVRLIHSNLISKCLKSQSYQTQRCDEDEWPTEFLSWPLFLSHNVLFFELKSVRFRAIFVDNYTTIKWLRRSRTFGLFPSDVAVVVVGPLRYTEQLYPQWSRNEKEGLSNNLFAN